MHGRIYTQMCTNSNGHFFFCSIFLSIYRSHFSMSIMYLHNHCQQLQRIPLSAFTTVYLFDPPLIIPSFLYYKN